MIKHCILPFIAAVNNLNLTFRKITESHTTITKFPMTKTCNLPKRFNKIMKLDKIAIKFLINSER